MTNVLSSRPHIQRLLALQQLLLDFGSVDRKVYIPPALEKVESDVEHSYSLAMLAWFLAPHFPHLNASTIIQLCMAHDVMEVYCGDTFSYDVKATSGQADREAAAIARLGREWADFPALIQAIHEYEAATTDEAKFVQALDKLQAALMDYLGEGKTWYKLGITFAKFTASKDTKATVSPEIAEYYYELREILVNNPHLFPEED